MDTKTKTGPKSKGKRGGRREGAGRPMGTGKYGEPTRAIRVPASLIPSLQDYLSQLGQKQQPALPFDVATVATGNSRPMPLYETKIAAGFPSPAEDRVEKRLDLNDYCIKNPNTTFFVRVQGDSMINAGIYPNDLLIVDLSLKAKNGSIIIAFVNGEFTVKRLKIAAKKQMWLMPENEDYQPLAITEEMDFRIWGVVTNVVHSCN